MNKKQFKKLIMVPLENSLNVEILFNGKEAWDRDYGYRNSQIKGMACDKLNGKIIIISWQNNFYNTLQTLFHEIGHIYLHWGESNFKGGSGIREIEAELVAIFTCKELNIYYNHRSFNYKNGMTDLEKMFGCYNGNLKPRYELIAKCCRQIKNVLKDIDQQCKFNKFKNC